VSLVPGQGYRRDGSIRGREGGRERGKERGREGEREGGEAYLGLFEEQGCNGIRWAIEIREKLTYVVEAA